MDYFTKWVEAAPMKAVTVKDMVRFVKEHIIYRFGIPQIITTDQGTVFTADEFKDFAASMGIKILNSSPYYAQANEQAEASNKSLIKLIKRKIEVRELAKLRHVRYRLTSKMRCPGHSSHTI